MADTPAPEVKPTVLASSKKSKNSKKAAEA
jgi:hypothetical protein